MKNHSLSNSALPLFKAWRPSLCLALGSLFSVSPLVAADYLWDANGAAAGTGGTGTWAAANAWRDSAATGALGNWVDGNAAIFGGTSGTTTVAANVAVSGMTISTANHNIIGAGRIDFGAGGLMNLTNSGIEVTAPLAGTVILLPSTGTLGSATTAFFKADSTGLVSTTLSGNDPNRNIILDHPGSFGLAGASVTVSNAILGLGALTTEALGQAVANGSGGGLGFNAWNLSLAGAVRSRAGANTLNGPVTLTGNSTLLCRGAAGVKLTFSNTATINLGSQTLLLSPIAASSGIELQGAITGMGGITMGDSTLTGAGLVNAASVATLAGANTYTGPTVVNKGTLNLTGSLTSDVTIDSGANLSGEGSTTAALSFNGTSTLTFNPATPAALRAARVDAGAAAVTLNFPGLAAAGTGIVIIDAPGGITGAAGTNFLFTGRGRVYLNGTNTQLLFDYTPASLTWSGLDPVNPFFWDTNVTSNWRNGAAADKFLTSDLVILDDGAASFTVTAQGTEVQPGAVLINNDVAGRDYLFDGAPIGGNGSVTKQGRQKATFASNNTYTGGTTISAGTLQLGDGISAAGSAGPGDILNNGSLIVNSGPNNRTFFNNISGTGTLEYSGTALFNVAGNVTLTGATTIQSGNLQIGNGGFTGTISGNIVNNATLSFNRTDAITVANLISGSGNISKTLGAAVTLAGANTFTGSVTVSGTNQLLIAGSDTALGGPEGSTVITAGARLELTDGRVIAGETAEISGASVNFNGALQAQAGAAAAWNGPIRLNSADARIGGGIGSILTVRGSVHDGTFNALNIGTGTGGTGTVIIATPAGGNTYTGATNLIRGTLQPGAANCLPATTVLDVDASTAAEPCLVDLNGFSQTVAGLQRGNAAGGTATLTNRSATAATLTVNQNTDTLYSGTLTGNFSLIKEGTGTLNTTGPISYEGNTTIAAGTLGFAGAGLSDTATARIASGAVAALNFAGNDRVGALVINGVTLPDGVYSNTSHGGNYAAFLTGPGALQVGVSGYASWIAGFPTLTGNDALPEADPEADGMANLMEFVLGGSPLLGDAGALTTTAASPDGLNLTFGFKRSDASETDTTLRLQTSTDPGTWPAGADIIIGPNSNTAGTLPGGITYTIQENAEQPDDVVVVIPRGSDGRKFIRLKAGQP